MKLSVSIVSFNQERYIRQAVVSALAQVTDFEIEIIVGDDASTDGTPDLLKEMAAEDPRIRLILHEKNFGDNGLSNFMSTVDAAEGDFIAFLDGDDYWTATDKLQRQVDFLCAHPDCAIAVHRTLHLLGDGRAMLSPRPAFRDSELPVRRLIVSNFAEKISTVVRREALANVPEWYRTTTAISADWIFNVMAARGASVGYLDSVMASHRLHADSLSVRYGTVRLLKDKRESIDLVRSYFPEEGAAFRRAELYIKLKLAMLRLSPSVYMAIKSRQRVWPNPTAGQANGGR